MKNFFVLTLTTIGLVVQLQAQSGSGGITVSPPAIELVLNPGASTVVDLQVCIPGQSGVGQADVYFLADTTGSMGSVIGQVKSNAAAIISNLLGRTGIDVQIGVGRYRDFPSDAFAFNNQLAITDNPASVSAAIQAWSASGGGDTPEGQLYALQRIATTGEIGWRPGAKRIIVWFGDAPGHDPVCGSISGLPFNITEISATGDLKANGPGGTAVIAISTTTGAANGLNGNPNAGATNYGSGCPPAGVAGQADRIAAATAGVSLANVTPAQITAAILDSIDVVLSDVDVSLGLPPALAQFVTGVTPSIVNVTIPEDPELSVCANFKVTFMGAPCEENEGSMSAGEISVLIDGAASGATVPTTIEQPDCGSVCLMLLGFSSAFQPVVHPLATPADVLLVAPPYLALPVTMVDLPNLLIPDSPQLAGLRIYTQVVMLNEIDFPTDPVQLSNGLAWSLGGGVETYGVSSGLTQWGTSLPNLGGALQIDFSIDAWE